MVNGSSKRERVGAEAIRVLHVEDDPEFADLTETFLQRQHGAMKILTEHSAAAAIDRLAATTVDCVVSDYDMPGSNGLEFLETVREEHPDLPFILFTGKGSEEVAGEAISAGVTDYLQKGGGADAFGLLANRIVNAVSSRRARTNYREIMENVPDGIVVQDPETAEFLDMNREYCELFGYTRDEFFEAGFEAIHPGEPPYTAENARNLVREAVEVGPQTFQWPGIRQDGERIWCEVNLRPARLDGELRLLAAVRDVSDRRAQKEALEYERDRLTALFRSVPEPVVHIRLEDGEPVVVRTNEAFETVFGYADTDVHGASLDDLIVPDRFRDEARDINRQTVGADAIEREVVRETRDGESRFRFKAAPIVQEADEVEWVGTYVDIADRES
jgi:PAS domain S-box-containing protein